MKDRLFATHEATGTIYRMEWPARPGFEDRPHRAKTRLDLDFAEALAWALATYSPFHVTPTT